MRHFPGTANQRTAGQTSADPQSVDQYRLSNEGCRSEAATKKYAKSTRSEDHRIGAHCLAKGIQTVLAVAAAISSSVAQKTDFSERKRHDGIPALYQRRLQQSAERNADGR